MQRVLVGSERLDDVQICIPAWHAPRGPPTRVFTLCSFNLVLPVGHAG